MTVGSKDQRLSRECRKRDRENVCGGRGVAEVEAGYVDAVQAEICPRRYAELNEPTVGG